MLLYANRWKFSLQTLYSSTMLITLATGLTKNNFSVSWVWTLLIFITCEKYKCCLRFDFKSILNEHTFAVVDTFKLLQSTMVSFPLLSLHYIFSLVNAIFKFLLFVYLQKLLFYLRI